MGSSAIKKKSSTIKDGGREDGPPPPHRVLFIDESQSFDMSFLWCTTLPQVVLVRP